MEERLPVTGREEGPLMYQEGAMKCMDCGAEMNTARENYRYDDCGLPYVVLEDVEVSRCSACGNIEVSIPAIEDVHEKIAWFVAQKSSRLTPDEVKFLRKYMGFSSGDFAEILGVDLATVSRWENGVRQMSSVADRLVRVLALTRQPASKYPIEKLREIDKDKAQPVRVELTQTEDRGWAAAGATP
jgi:putative zinc finger/helix-turn-helix YgiT family protein